MILVYHLGHGAERLVLLFSLSVWNVNCSQREISRLPDLDLYFHLLFFSFTPARQECFHWEPLTVC